MTAQTVSRSLPLSRRVLAGLSAVLFGSVLLYGVGFAQDSRMHNAAHDTRHAIGFPCH
jgi:cobalt transporter subunit CbtB